MANSQANMEITDVLSSIRRLVSEDRTSGAAPAAVPEPEGPVTQGGAPEARAEGDPADLTGSRLPAESRFVLTAALRVHREGADAAEDAEPAPAAEAAFAADVAPMVQPEDEVPAVTAPMSLSSLESTIAELEAAVASLPSGFEPDGGDAIEIEDVESEMAWSSLEVRNRPLADFGSRAQGFENHMAVEDRLDTPITGDNDTQPLPDRVARHWHPVEREPEPTYAAEPVRQDKETAADLLDGLAEMLERAPAVEEGDFADGDDPLALGEADAAGDDFEVADVPQMSFRRSADTYTPASAHTGANTVEEAIAPFSAAGLDDREETHAPEAEEAVPEETGTARLHFGGTAGGRPVIVRPGMEEPSAPDEVAESEPETAAEAAGFDDASEDDDLFDPLSAAETDIDVDMLRDLVAELIRDELRGSLGERITRNLRALVKREIDKALIAEGLKQAED